ncbi:MAG: OsmC family protein [candidate division KSB1 bacterium]|nr:OsmC family protein [candidate division KSB1 bacterium]MDZ7337441.1 OsmC family protein [candidate division KSB1 bacterium]MDZ7385514.1 OsmC family protein [candidate division KSB1 bacterium]MDZ7393305.1 OsmC family protein [candidate division KSB1 bacterium]MDZ7413159.1 OsmC family protein [candidate division KSB1 bacterium]
MKAIVRQVQGLTFVGKADSNHWVAMDADPKVGGSNAGSRPMELLLVALAGCTGMDVASILDKMRVKYDDFYMEVEADRAKEHPKTFTAIRLKYVLVGDNIPPEAVNRAVQLSQSTYCSVSAMLRQACEISVDVEIRPKQAEQGR